MTTSFTWTSLSGPLGIKQALEANAGEHNAVIASGWGAANLSLLMLLHDADLSQTVVVLDNDVAAPDGGFGTRYPWFALIGVNPFPTPSETDALAAVNTSYEYDYNSSAPADVLNPLAAVNSLVAYLYRHLNQAELDLPVNPDGTPAVSCDANTCAITQSGDDSGLRRRPLQLRPRTGSRRTSPRGATPPTSPTPATDFRWRT